MATKQQTAADRMHWETYEFPWGDTQCAPYMDDADRVIVRWADMPETWVDEDDQERVRPVVARSTDTDRLFAVYSWMNDRVMLLLSDVGEGVTISWSMCGECNAYWTACKCHGGITEPRSVRWARKRSEDDWRNPTEAKNARYEAEAARVAVSAPVPSGRAAARRGSERAAESRSGRASVPVPDEPVPTLAEVDKAAGSVADDLVAQAMGKTRKSTKR